MYTNQLILLFIALMKIKLKKMKKSKNTEKK